MSQSNGIPEAQLKDLDKLVQRIRENKAMWFCLPGAFVGTMPMRLVSDLASQGFIRIPTVDESHAIDIMIGKVPPPGHEAHPAETARKQGQKISFNPGRDIPAGKPVDAENTASPETQGVEEVPQEGEASPETVEKDGIKVTDKRRLA